MDGSQVLECFEALWFFHNVLTPATQFMGPAPDGDAVNQKASESINDRTPQVKDIDCAAEDEMVSRSPNRGDFAAEKTEPETVLQLEPVKEAAAVEIVTEKAEKRRRRRIKRSKRKILVELDLGFQSNIFVPGFWLFQETYGYRNFGSPYYQMKMPPLNDGMAMKEHLKSWAYAVACTVR